MLAMLDKKKKPIVLQKETVKFGRIELEVATIAGKGQQWQIPLHCVEDLEALLLADDALCGHE